MTTSAALQEVPLERGLAEHRRGRLEAAEHAYRAVLAVDPEHPDALHLLGVVLHQGGRSEEAIALIARAIERHPSEAVYFSNLGDACRAAGRHEDATRALRQALALDPKLAEAHNNLGLTLEEQGERDAAKGCFRRALALAPGLLDAEINLANALVAEGAILEATERFERVLRLEPDNAKAHYNLANALRDQDLLDAAIGHYEAALGIQPDYVDALNNYGLALARTGARKAAAAAFESALLADPAHAEALNNLGLARLREADLDAAESAFRSAIRAAPGHAAPHDNLGTLHHRAGRSAAAAAAFRRAIDLDPDYAPAHANLGALLEEQGREAESVEVLLRAVERGVDRPDATARLLRQLRHLARFDRLPGIAARVDAQSEAALRDGRRPGESPFDAYLRRSDPAFHRRLAEAWAAGLEHEAKRRGLRFEHGSRRRSRERLRIGYLSAHFRDHPITHQIRRVLEAHDRRRVEVTAYGYGEADDGPERRRIAAAVDRFVDLARLDDAEAAKRIYADETDILVDLTGYAPGARAMIPACRPAPVQVGWLGMPGTAGGRLLDYLLADPVCVPAAEFEHYREQVVHLPHCCLPFGEDGRPRGACGRADYGLPEAGFVFVSPNETDRIEPVMFDLWLALLRAVPESVLWLLQGSADAARNLRCEAEARGVAGERLVFAARVSHAHNLKRLRLADLALDTRTHNGGPAIAAALFAGVPVIGLIGTDFTSRLTASMLTTLRMPDLLASSLQDYRRKAEALAGSPERLRALKGRLEANLGETPLFDPGRFAGSLEDAFEAMWQRFAGGLPPRSFRVAPR